MKSSQITRSNNSPPSTLFWLKGLKSKLVCLINIEYEKDKSPLKGLQFHDHCHLFFTIVKTII